eukprot:11024973-Alexandrium_andersonii.AAC.1
MLVASAVPWCSAVPRWRCASTSSGLAAAHPTRAVDAAIACQRASAPSRWSSRSSQSSLFPFW